MEVENHPKWKETNIEWTQVPLPWLWEEGWLIFQKIPKDHWSSRLQLGVSCGLEWLMSMIRCGLFGVFNVDHTPTNYSSKPKTDVSEESLSIFRCELFCAFRNFFLGGRGGVVAKKKKLQSILEKMRLYTLNNSAKRKLYHLQMFLFLSEKRNVHCNDNLTS